MSEAAAEPVDPGVAPERNRRPERPERPERIERIADTANITGILVTPLLLVLLWPANGPVSALLRGAEPNTQRRLAVLEEQLRREPGDVRTATEVGRLWQSLGQPPWSYTALREAERKGPGDAESLLALGAAYLDLGELDDSRRALKGARHACSRRSCAEPVDIKISLLTTLTDNLVKQGIEPRRDLAFTERAFRKVLREMAGKAPQPPKPRR